MLLAFAVVIEGNVCDLLVLAVHLAAIIVDGVHLDRLAKGVILPRLRELGLACRKSGDDLLGHDVLGRGWIERAEAGRGGILRRDGRDGESR
jgi:hypothetical protein